MPVHRSDMKAFYHINVAVVQSRNDNLNPQTGIEHHHLPSNKSRTRCVNDEYVQKYIHKQSICWECVQPMHTVDRVHTALKTPM